MSLLFRPLEMFAYETPPNSAESTEVPSSESGGGTQEPSVLSRDDFDRFQQSVNERFDAIGQSVSEGFGWVRENLAQQSPAVEGEPNSPLESPPDPTETVIQVQDRQTVRNKKPRAHLNLGSLFR